MEQFDLGFDLFPQRRVFSVSELNGAIRAILDGEFSDISVTGEISGLKLATSGHYYFTLKEREAQVKAVAFRSAHRYWKFKPQDGLAVLARGRIDVYEARGEYQLMVEHLEPQGLGALQLAFEQLKKKLAAEGLFARRTQASAAALSAAHRDRHFAARRRHRRHGPDSLAPLSGPAHPALPGAGAGRGLDRRGLPRHRVFQPHEVGRTW